MDAPVVQFEAPSHKQSNISHKRYTDTEEFGSCIPFDDNDESISSMDQDVDVNNTAEQPSSAINQVKVSMIAWSSDDKWCIVASNQGEIRVYYAYDGRPACMLKGHRGEVYALDNHPLDPSTLLSAGYDGNVILWDLARMKMITRHHHAGRTFTDSKFSKDGNNIYPFFCCSMLILSLHVGMKYAITDEEGHCTLYGIGGLEKDYEQVRSWERGQYFMSDYQALRYFTDGSFVDEATQQMPYALPPSSIIDLQGVAYPNQKKLGYGKIYFH